MEENWRVYLDGANSKYNPFPDDGFSYTLLAHTDLTRESGQNNGVDLKNVRWDNYDLVVIDESHNLRNRKSSRYEKLMEAVVKGGKGTKFLLLSATPVNVDLSDLHNQIALFSGDDDAAFRESLGIRNLKTTLKEAQKAFIKWSLLPSAARTANALSLELPPAFFHLLDGVSIARSRKQIKEHYADSLAEIGAFPIRRKPEYISSEVDLKGHFSLLRAPRCRIVELFAACFQALDLRFRRVQRSICRYDGRRQLFAGDARALSHRHDEDQFSQAIGKQRVFVRRDDESHHQ